ncbi:hypothetical protein, conserved [Angomonas deanei]|uniref:Uncharacterized protein n=1 Tax=Angomonas deanei TaxID=59799 RepID=A0A7G2C4V1_9TRYP|nr:hypothetical protein, conserved [Angomonas deanei]
MVLPPSRSNTALTEDDVKYGRYSEIKELRECVFNPPPDTDRSNVPPFLKDNADNEFLFSDAVGGLLPYYSTQNAFLEGTGSPLWLEQVLQDTNDNIRKEQEERMLKRKEYRGSEPGA